MTVSFKWKSLKQLSIIKLIFSTLIPSIIGFIGFNIFAPALVNRGMPSLYSWLLVAFVLLSGLVLLAIILLLKEAKEQNISIFERMCFRKISVKMWAYTIIIMVVSIIVCSYMANLEVFLINKIGYKIPDYTPFFLNPNINPAQTDVSILTPGINMSGNYVVLLFIGLVLFLNILAEELYFRAWMLPKMAKYGKGA